MLFMKGSPDAPRCGFSRQIVEILQAEKVAFGHFDILTDEEVRQGLKTYSNWPTYPQLYGDGALIGGLDIVKEMKEDGELKAALPATATAEPLDARLKKLTAQSPVMLFMKGSPDAPRCGFSRQIVELLNGESVTFGHFDILSDEEVRQGLKTFSNWPTYPQLYAEGSLIGGLDIVKEMKEDGELKAALPRRRSPPPSTSTATRRSTATSTTAAAATRRRRAAAATTTATGTTTATRDVGRLTNV